LAFFCSIANGQHFCLIIPRSTVGESEDTTKFMQNLEITTYRHSVLQCPEPKILQDNKCLFSHNCIHRYFIFMLRIALTAIKQLFSLVRVDD